MTVAVFVDTNMLVYTRDLRVASKQEIARGWMSKLWSEQAGRTSFQVLGDGSVGSDTGLDCGGAMLGAMRLATKNRLLRKIATTASSDAVSQVMIAH